MTQAPSSPAEWQPLIDAAFIAQDRAHAPYSNYPVGAAVLTRKGTIFISCNVENASYGLSICAERSAVFQMVAAGEREPIAVVVVTPGPAVGTPCGACRQVLSEFAKDLPIYLVARSGRVPPRVAWLKDLLPDAFVPEDLATSPAG